MMHCPVCRNDRSAFYGYIEAIDYYQCRVCLAIFTDPKALLEKEQEHARYLLHENNADDPGYRRFLERLAVPVNSRLNTPSEGLDYGCGAAPLLAEILEEYGHSMQVYDPYFFPDTAPLQRSYDFITCSEAAEHFYNPAEEFERLAALLRPGGILGIMTSLWDESIDFATWYYRKDPTHVVFYHRQSFQTLSESLRFVCDFPEKNIIILQKI
jgi:SAM-dependent methyltransferase